MLFAAGESASMKYVAIGMLLVALALEAIDRQQNRRVTGTSVNRYQEA